MQMTRTLIAAAGLAAAVSPALGQTDYSWASPSDGLWSFADNWTPSGVPGAGSSDDSATLGLAGMYTVTMDTTRTISSLTLSNPDAVLAVRSGITLTVDGPIAGPGALIVNDQLSTSLATLNLGEGAVVTSPVRLNAQTGSSTRARITGQGTGATLNTDVLGNGRLLGILHNDGLIATELSGDEIFVATTGPLTSSGEVRVVNAGRLNISSGLDGGTLHADADSRVLSGSAGVSNATLTGDLVVASVDSLTLGTGNTYSGTITVHDQSSTSLTNLFLHEGASLGGTVLLNGPAGSDTRARITGEGTGATLDADISGIGRLLGVLHNTGTVSSDQPGGLILFSTSTPITSTGEFRAVNGGTLNISSGLDGGMLHADADSRVLGGSAGVSNATLSGTAVISAGNTLTLGTGNTYNGTITVHDQSSTSLTNLFLHEGASLGGTVLLNGPAGSDTRARITGEGTGATLDADISGIGRLLGVLHNTGTVSSDQPGGLILFSTSTPITSTGEFRAVNGGTLNISSGLDGGVLHGDADSRVQGFAPGISNATLTGNIVIASGNSLTLGPGNTYSGIITVKDQSSTSLATLNLADGVTLAGTIELNAGDQPASRARMVGPSGIDQSAEIGPDAVVRGQGRLLGSFDPVLGTISPGTDDAPGEINLLTTEPLVLTPQARSEFRVGPTDPDTYDRITVLGGLELGGTCAVELADGATPQFGDRWDIVQGSSGITGFYDAYDLPTPPPGLAYRVVIESGGVFVRLTCPADFNGDLTLNFFDISAFLGMFNNQDPRADLNGDGLFNFFDISAYLGAFGAGCP